LNNRLLNCLSLKCILGEDADTKRVLRSCIAILSCCFIAFITNANAQTTTTMPTIRPMQIDDLFRFKRLASPNISPDGKLVVYASTTIDADAGSSKSCLMLASTDGSSVPTQLTNSDKKDSTPRFSPDGRFVLFESNRSGASQIWYIAINGGEAKQLTNIATEASSAIWSPDGSKIAFVSSVYPAFQTGSDQEIADANANQLKADSERKSKVRIADRLFFRHWDSYVEGKRQHLFVLKIKQNGQTLEADGLPHDATPGDRDANPTSSTFSSGRDFCFSPDGSHLIFTATPTNNELRSVESWSTNYDLCRVSIDNTSTQWAALTDANEAADSGPQISLDGKMLSWRSQRVAGAEADRWLISTQSINPDGSLLGKRVEHTLKDDVSIGEFCWNGSKIVFSTEWQARHRIYELEPTSSKSVVIADQIGGIADISSSQNGTLVFAQSTLNAPNEVFIQKQNNITNSSHANDDLLSQLAVSEFTSTMEVLIEDNRELQMWIVTPPDFDASKKYPTVYMVHGGPQGAWSDAWSNRWNPRLWAAQGYIVALPNPRGSTGFGQEFTDQISGDWGGKCYRDLMAGADYVAALPYVDRDRMASAGASFGGYMMNWFAVSTDRFCTLITHCSVYNFESMWGTTDELWFDEYEHGGMPWEKPESYRMFSPQAKAANIGRYRTPMLVIHNDLDFRCPIGQGIELFTTLQRFNVPSRFVNFPDEGHWVSKPVNSRVWHEEVFGWLDKHCKNKP
jgi:dipeptidyl aminopeptidase/acylaminoacyl peptidase